nr:amidase family protein [Stakelama sediminis]
MVRDGDVAGDTLVEAAILRIEELDPKLNAVSYRAFDHARKALDAVDMSAPMAGVPILLKASLAYPGFPQTSCSRAKKDAVGTSAYPFTRRLDMAGLVSVGMSAMPEFGLLCSGEALLTGPTLNPWDITRTAGGSSTGAAVAVAAGMVPFAHASDAAGSIRLPASNCGVVGFKASRGWNLRARAHHLIDDLLCNDTLMARSVRDAAWALRMERRAGIEITEHPDRPLRIAVDLDGLGGTADDEVADIIRQTASLCVDIGHQVEAVTMPIDRSALRNAIFTLWPYLGGDLVDQFSALHPETPIGDLLEPWTIGLAEAREHITPEQLERCYTAIVEGQQAVAAFHQDWDVVLSPVTRSAPLPVGAMAPTRAFADLWQTLFDYVDYTPLHNLVGTPSVSLPLGMTQEGVPIGSLFSGAHGSDDLLLMLAAQLEAAAPWADRWPAMVPMPVEAV